MLARSAASAGSSPGVTVNPTRAARGPDGRGRVEALDPEHGPRLGRRTGTATPGDPPPARGCGPAGCERAFDDRCRPAGIGTSISRRSAGPPRAGSGPTAMNASSARVAGRRRGIASWATVTRTSRRAGGRARMISTRATPLATPRTRPRARKVNSLTVTRPASPAQCSLVGATISLRSVAASTSIVNSGSNIRPISTGCVDPGTVPRRNRPCTSRGPMVDSARRRHLRSSVPARVLEHQGKARPLGHRPAHGIPRPACRRVLAPVQHRVPGSVPGRDELPRLPEPGRRGPVRGGLHPVARPEPGRRDVLVRLLGAVRAGLPPRRHRPAARDPGDEALPRRVARGLGHPRRHAPDHAARGAGRGGRRRAGRAGRRPRAGDEGLPGHGLRQPAVRRRHDAHRRPRVPPAARGDRDGRPARRAARRQVRVRHDDRASTSRSTSSSATSTRSRSPPARWTRSRSTSRAPTSRASTTASTS